MSRCSNIIRWLICKIKYEIISNGRITLGFTGNISRFPLLKANNGIIMIGAHCGFENCEIVAVNGGSIEIGNYTTLGSNDLLVSRNKIHIGEHCSIAPNVSIYDHDHKFNKQGIISGYNTSEIYIGNNVWIGVGVIILKGAKIGNNCVIGAGSVICSEVKPCTIVYNNREITSKNIDW